MRWILALLVCAFAGMAECAEKDRPHIVVVLADDMGLGDLSCYGGDIVKTPNLDQIAREGTRFTQYYSAAPICSPARCGLITGQFPARWHITSFLQEKKGNRGCEMADFLDPKAPSLPRVLKSAGYATAHYGKWHLGGGRDVTEAPKFAAYGYDDAAGTWESPEPHPDITASNWIWSDKDKVKRWDRTAFFVDRTLDFIKQHSDQPCFVNVWLDDPHTPWVPEATKAGQQQRPQARDNLEKVLQEVDKQMGRLAQALPANTLLIFVSDNGPLPTFQATRAVNKRGSKLSLYEGGINVPFIARWPNHVPAGVVNDSAVIGGVDLRGTAHSVGLTPATVAFGRPLAPSGGAALLVLALGVPDPATVGEVYSLTALCHFYDAAGTWLARETTLGRAPAATTSTEVRAVIDGSSGLPAVQIVGVSGLTIDWTVEALRLEG